MYDALLFGIASVGAYQFSWDTTNQQVHFREKHGTLKTYIQQTISNIYDAQEAIALISNQGEGNNLNDLAPPQPYSEKDFMVPEKYRFKSGTEHEDPDSLGQYSHFGRFLWVKNQVDANGYPPVYVSYDSATQQEYPIKGYAEFLCQLNAAWTSPATANVDFFKTMGKLLSRMVDAWQAGNIPNWDIFPPSSPS